ncbi:Helix-turn-helix domain-containing protein [Thermomonospora echinospora]|uniref:Helix-turn-helix domain-containing protein n=1 Tax=Thermomonospora echinospora TaxID=1992 RepID=A0A1H6E5N5_9ACTN|nr:helix-turn-helix transcriptional regulator [Thermomonospora echinospora]SEG92205.1 Helix-turn-helix domain-containing protein [Thermomonospora echinospora]
MSDDRRKRFGAYLARMRRKANKSQRQLAEMLCRISGTASVTRNEVSRWERGERVPTVWLPALATALGIHLDELERAAEHARGDDIQNGTPSPAETLAILLPDHGEHLGPLASHVGRRIGMSTADGLAARAHGLRLADDVIAGGDLIAPAFRELNAAIRLYRETTHTEEVGRALLASIAEMAQIAGWIASDAGQHDQAERAYRLGVSAAREAQDSTLAGNLAGSLAYQLSNTGQEDTGLSLAQAALEEAGPDAPGKTRALYLDRVAWAHTKKGQNQQAMRALGEAHEALTEDGADEAPTWAYWVSAEELDVMDARVYTELHKPLRAVPLLQEVLSRYDATHARELALYLSWLAVALADANEPEEAANTTRRILDLTSDLTSDRTNQRTRVVLAKLEPFRHVPEVREILDEHAA